MPQFRASIQFKVVAYIAVVFLPLLVFMTWRSASSEKEMVSNLVAQKVLDTARGYFDGLNTMMLTGTMGQSGILREKILSHPDITEVRLIRGEAIAQSFGAGAPEQKTVDALDQRALAGEAITVGGEDAAGRSITVLEPIRASANFHGTNCLTCHAVPENTVLGAIRVSYSLAALDKEIYRRNLATAGTNVGLLAVGMVLITWLMRRIVITRLARMSETMHVIERDADLTQRLAVDSDDEIGKLATAFNSMLANFSASLASVSTAAGELNTAIGKISGIASQTTGAAMEQRSETSAVIDAIGDLESSVEAVRASADRAQAASIEADHAASEGAQSIKAAIDGIYGLVAEIENAADEIKRLDDKSKGVGAVLDVIRGIAEQTNLLALNAAIEAARAGEHGRGFAVVADEVRTLATRSHESTEEIKSIVEQLQVEARKAVAAMSNAKEIAEQRSEQVKNTDEVLALIADRVAHIRQLNEQMADVADVQSGSAQNVNRSILNIGQLAERTAQDAQQTNAYSDNLVELAARLNQMVARFKR